VVFLGVILLLDGLVDTLLYELGVLSFLYFSGVEGLVFCLAGVDSFVGLASALLLVVGLSGLLP
jgi:hypothetical protein